MNDTNYEILLNRGASLTRAFQEKRVAVESSNLRLWLGDAAQYKDSAAPELLRYWGIVLSQFLTQNSTSLPAQDGLLVSNYLSAISRCSPQELTTEDIPEDYDYSTGKGQMYREHFKDDWSSAPLYQNTMAILKRLARTKGLEAVLVDCFANRSLDIEALISLFRESGRIVVGPQVQFKDIDRLVAGSLFACLPALLANSAWRPSSGTMACYKTALVYATWPDAEDNVSRIENCRKFFPTNAGMQITSVFHNEYLKREDIEAIMPLSVDGLIEPKCLRLIVKMHLDREKAASWNHFVEYFAQHHPKLAGLLNVHLALFPDGEPLDMLMPVWSEEVSGAAPETMETYSLAELLM